MSKTREVKAYELTYMPEYQRICARGDIRILQDLATFPGAWVHGNFALAPTHSYVSLPASRTAFFTCEAISTPISVSDYYHWARPFYVTFDLSTLYQRWAEYRMELNPDPDRVLRHHQLEFSSFAWGRRGVLNASEQGTGKTAMGWIIAHLWQAKRVLILTNKSLIKEWADEYDLMFAKRPPIHCVPLNVDSARARGTTLRSFRKHTTPVACVINYDVLRHLEDDVYEYAPDVLICDESWKLKNRKSQTAQLVCNLADQARHVGLFTGTPIGNDIGDLWMQLRLIYGPHFSAGYKKWDDAYSAFMTRLASFMRVESQYGVNRKPIGIANVIGLMQILEPVWFRASKSVCLDIPPKIYKPDVILDLPKETRELYDRVVEHGEAALGAELSLADERVVMIRLQQITGGFLPSPVPITSETEMSSRHVGGFAPEGPNHADLHWVERDEIEYGVDNLGQVLGIPMAYKWEQIPLDNCPKLAWCKNFSIDKLLGDPTCRTIFWCKHNHEVKRLTIELQKILGEDRVKYVIGGIKESTLDDIKRSFNSRHPEGIQVIVAQCKKLFAGHNLQAADYHIRVSYTHSYIEWSQAEDRSDRMGRKTSVVYITLRIRRSIDGGVLNCLRNKQDVSVQISKDSTMGREIRDMALS